MEKGRNAKERWMDYVKNDKGVNKGEWNRKCVAPTLSRMAQGQEDDDDDLVC